MIKNSKIKMSYPNILAVDTSTSKLSVTVYSNNKFYSYEEDSLDHSEKLILALDTLLNKARIKVKDLDVIGVNTGPGSFTGLRIGLCFVRELLTFCKMKNVVTTNSFMMLLYEFNKKFLQNIEVSCNEIVTLFPSVKNEFYYCRFIVGTNKIKKVGKESYVRKEILEKMIDKETKHTVYFVVPEIAEFQESDKITKVKFSSTTVTKMIIEQNKKFYKLTDIGTLSPFYLRHTYYK